MNKINLKKLLSFISVLTVTVPSTLSSIGCSPDKHNTSFHQNQNLDEDIVKSINDIEYTEEVPDNSTAKEVKDLITPELIKSELNSPMKSDFNEDSFRVNKIKISKNNNFVNPKQLTNEDLKTKKDKTINAIVSYNYGTKKNQETHLKLTVKSDTSFDKDIVNSINFLAKKNILKILVPHNIKTKIDTALVLSKVPVIENLLNTTLLNTAEITKEIMTEISKAIPNFDFLHKPLEIKKITKINPNISKSILSIGINYAYGSIKDANTTLKIKFIDSSDKETSNKTDVTETTNTNNNPNTNNQSNQPAIDFNIDSSHSKNSKKTDATKDDSKEETKTVKNKEKQEAKDKTVKDKEKQEAKDKTVKNKEKQEAKDKTVKDKKQAAKDKAERIKKAKEEKARASKKKFDKRRAREREEKNNKIKESKIHNNHNDHNKRK